MGNSGQRKEYWNTYPPCSGKNTANWGKNSRKPPPKGPPSTPQNYTGSSHNNGSGQHRSARGGRNLVLPPKSDLSNIDTTQESKERLRILTNFLFEEKPSIVVVVKGTLLHI